MTIRKFLLWFIFVDFAVFSTWVLWQDGYLSIWQAGFTTQASLQILLDLVISCLLIGVWLRNDALAQGINPYPWLIAIATLGSLASLGYLLLREYRKEDRSLQSKVA